MITVCLCGISSSPTPLTSGVKYKFIFTITYGLTDFRRWGEKNYNSREGSVIFI